MPESRSPEPPHDPPQDILDQLRLALPQLIKHLPAEFAKRQADQSHSTRFSLMGWVTGYFDQTASICALAIICATIVLLAVILFAPDKINFVLSPCVSIISVALTAAVGGKKKKDKSKGQKKNSQVAGDD